jgi:CTP:molybdopterin cytidylyltransferase MocA
VNPASAAALVLSAGFSERMGDFKPLMTLGGETLLERVVRLFQSVGVGAVHVVVGHRAAQLTPRVEGLGARCVFNPAYGEGMFSSVKAGAASLAAGTEAIFVLPVDIPLVRPSTLRELLAALPAGGSAVCHPTFGGRRGHPPLIGGRHIRRIFSWREEGGLAALLCRLEAHARDVPVVDEGIHLDMDRPQDHRCLAERLKSRGVLSPAECGALLERLQVPPAVAAHCRAVADVASRIAQTLNAAGAGLDLGLVRGAALVHDMLRGTPNHALRGGALLRALDLPLVAEVVEAHMDIALRTEGPVREAEVVYLADKLVMGDRFVGLADRFVDRLGEKTADPGARAAARRRLDAARAIAGRVRAATGRSLESFGGRGQGEIGNGS